MSTLLIEIGCEELPYKVCESVVRQLEGAGDAPGLVRQAAEAEDRLLEARRAAGQRCSSRRGASPCSSSGVPARQTAEDRRLPRSQGGDRLRRRRRAHQGRAGVRALARRPGPRTCAARSSTAPSSRSCASRPSAPTPPTCCPASSPALVTRPADPARHALGRAARPARRTTCASRAPSAGCVCKLGGATVRGAFYGLDVRRRDAGSPRARRAGRHRPGRALRAAPRRSRRWSSRSTSGGVAIVEGLDARAAELGGEWSDPGDVLAEAVYLAEWPSVARGAFAEPSPAAAGTRCSSPPCRATSATSRCGTATAACCRPSSTSATPIPRPPTSSRAATSACSTAGWTTPSSPTTATSPRASTPWPTGSATWCSTRSSARSPTRRAACRGWWPVWPPGAGADGAAPGGNGSRRRSPRRCAPPRGSPRPTS